MSIISRRYSCELLIKRACFAVFIACGNVAMAQGQVLVQPLSPVLGQLPEQGKGQVPLSPPPPPQAWHIESYLGATVTATDNSALATAALLPEDMILEIAPRLVVSGRGASFALDADVTGRALLYAKSTQDNRLLPAGTVALKANLVDKWIYLDAAVTADQIVADPFAPRADTGTGINKINSLGYRLSPYLKHDFTPSLAFFARSDNYWTKRRADLAANDPRRDSLVQKQSALLERKPVPFGFTAEASQETTTYRTGSQDTLLQIDSARAVATYALDPTFVIGVVGGAEKVESALASTSDQIVGGRISWAPTQRTELKGSYEKRFFGNGGSLEWRHRSPFIGMSLSAAREPTAVGSSFVLSPALGAVPTLLDAIYTTRYPDPMTRAAIVSGVISGLGLPNALGEPVEVFSSYAQLRDSVSASIVFQGVRSTVAARLYAIKLRPLNLADSPLTPALPLLSDNFQRGMSMDFNRKLTAVFSANVSLGYADIEGLGDAAGQSTTNALIRVSLGQNLSAKTALTYGARYQVDRFILADRFGAISNGEVRERAAFIGIVHRF